MYQAAATAATIRVNSNEEPRRQTEKRCMPYIMLNEMQRYIGWPYKLFLH